MPTNLYWTIAARTDTGRQRAANEDAFAVLDVERQRLHAQAAFVVADGMGGMHAGDVASREAVRAVAQTLGRRLADPEADPQAALNEALRSANQTVHALAAAPPPGEDDTPMDRRGVRSGESGDAPPAGASDAPGMMGTTCVAAVIKNDALHLAHVGDSRAYLFRGGRLSRLTRDHSFVEERVLAGDLTEEQARRSRFRNMITRAVGIEPDVEPELKQEPLEPGDTLLICTDGLTTMLPDAEIEALLSRSAGSKGPSLENAAGALVEAANRRGGADNITVLLAHTEDVRAPNKPAVAAAVPPPDRSPTRRDRRAAPAVVDLDAPEPPAPPRRRSSPLLVLLAILGLAALALAAALAFWPGLRARARSLLAAGAAEPARGAGALAPPPPAILDLTRVTYGKPETFGSFLARGDVLAYSPKGGLYFVGFASGKVAALSRTGEVLRARPLATLPLAPPPPTPIPPSRTFFATDPQGNGYICYTARKIIEKYDREGRLLLTLSGFQRPEALAVDEDGNLYVVDYNLIKKLSAQFPPPKPQKTTASPKKGPS